MNRPFRPRFFLIFAVLSVALVLVMDNLVFGVHGGVSEKDELTHVMQSLIEPAAGDVDAASVDLDGVDAMLDQPLPEQPEAISVAVQPDISEEVQVIEAVEAQPKAAGPKKPRVAIIIDDVGMDIRHSRRALDLPAPVTIAILPYAPMAKDFAAVATAKGHELIIHTPMEAMDPKMNLGPLALRASYTPDQFDSEFEKILASFEGYVGINNHMGSKLTQDKDAMARVMETLKERGLFFVDSRTIHTSVAAETAEAYEVPVAQRDVFLDHEETAAFTDDALANVERIARENGSAIAIGHPKEITMSALESWIADAQKRGIEFVPVSTLTHVPGNTNLGAVSKPVQTVTQEPVLPPG